MTQDHNSHKDDHQEFHEFLNGEEILPPREVDHQILSEIHSHLHPTFAMILLKLSLVQGFVGTITLLFCPQFELSLTSNAQMFHIFHRLFGYYGCLAACGIIFLGSGALVASLLFNRDEVRKINSQFYAFFPSVAILSLGALFLFGATIFIDIAIYWSLGGIFGSSLIFYISSLLKIKINGKSWN